MKKNSLFLLVGLLLFSQAAFAAPELSSTSLLTIIQTVMYKFYINIQVYALKLLWALTLVQFTWTILKKLVKGEFEITASAALLMNACIRPGIYTLFIVKGLEWLPQLFESFKLFATTGTGIDWVEFNPSAIMDMGIDVSEMMKSAFLKTEGVVGMIGLTMNPLPAILFAVGDLVILAAFGIMALNFFVTIAEMYILMGIAPMLWAFGGLDHTKDIALKTWNGMIAIGVKIVVLGIILSIGRELGPAMAAEAGTMGYLNWSPLWHVAFAACGFAYLAIKAGQIAGNALSGTSSLSAGEALSMGVAAAGAAVGLAGAAIGGAAGMAGLARNMMGGAGGGNAIEAIASGVSKEANPLDSSLWKPTSPETHAKGDQAAMDYMKNHKKDSGNAGNASLTPADQAGYESLRRGIEAASNHTKNLQGLTPNDSHSVGGDLIKHHESQ